MYFICLNREDYKKFFLANLAKTACIEPVKQIFSIHEINTAFLKSETKNWKEKLIFTIIATTTYLCHFLSHLPPHQTLPNVLIKIKVY